MRGVSTSETRRNRQARQVWWGRAVTLSAWVVQRSFDTRGAALVVSSSTAFGCRSLGGGHSVPKPMARPRAINQVKCEP